MYSFIGDDGLPDATLEVSIDEDTRRSEYLATVSITGLAPNRETTREERSAGIESLSPPTVRAGTVQDVVDLLERATLASVEATEGLDVTPDVIANLWRIRWSVAACFRSAGIDA